MIYSAFVLWLGNRFDNSKNKILRIFISFLSAPIAILILILRFLGPFMTLAWSLIIYVVFSTSLPVLILSIINAYVIIPIDIIYFVTCSSSSIIAIAIHKNIMSNIIKMHPANKIGPSKSENKYFVELTLYVFNANNVRFLIYLLYFIFLIFYSLASLRDESVFATAKIDYSILQAFLVFLAYDNLRINSKDLKIIATKVLNDCLNIIKWEGSHVENND